MLGKILVTGAVCLLAYFYWRHQRQLKSQTSAHPNRPALTDHTQPRPFPFKWFLALCVGFVLVSGVIAAGYNWHHQNQLLKVEVTNPHDGSQNLYWVARKNLGDRQFITQEGQQIRLSSSDRMQVSSPRSTPR